MVSKMMVAVDGVEPAFEWHADLQGCLLSGNDKAADIEKESRYMRYEL
jgi:hypothetical protein